MFKNVMRAPHQEAIIHFQCNLATLLGSEYGAGSQQKLRGTIENLKLLMDIVLTFKQITNQVCRLSVEKYRQYNIENIIKQSKTKKKNV